MFVNRRDVQIQWGDCDPANIVYYPRYFEMFDDSTSVMFCSLRNKKASKGGSSQ
jgi:4-hydroxybenzoyl-CoA thioesterase